MKTSINSLFANPNYIKLVEINVSLKTLHESKSKYKRAKIKELNNIKLQLLNNN